MITNSKILEYKQRTLQKLTKLRGNCLIDYQYQDVSFRILIESICILFQIFNELIGDSWCIYSS